MFVAPELPVVFLAGLKLSAVLSHAIAPPVATLRPPAVAYTVPEFSTTTPEIQVISLCWFRIGHAHPRIVTEVSQTCD